MRKSKILKNKVVSYFLKQGGKYMIYVDNALTARLSDTASKIFFISEGALQ